MYHLVIDTCVWIDLCGKLTKLRDKIVALVNEGKIRLIVPEIVFDEWDRNKPGVIAEQEKSIRGKIKNAKGISKHLETAETEMLTGILDRIQARYSDIEQSVADEIGIVDELLNHSSAIRLETTDEVKLRAADLALAKKAPFGDRNSMADALIVLTAVDYATERDLTNCIFVSSNISDFASKSDKAEIHPDLRPLLERCEMRYYSNIGLAVNEIEADLVSAASIEEIESDLQIAALLREAFAKTQRQMTESIRTMLEVPSIGEAFVESQRQMMANVRSALDLSSMIDNLRVPLPRVERPDAGEAPSEAADEQEELESDQK